MKKQNSQIVIYKDKNGNIKIDVRFDGDTVWLTQAHMADLFQKDRKTITEHIRNIFKEGELIENSVCRKFQHTAADSKKYMVNFYNLEVIISVGYRVSSNQGTAFRKWATERLL